MANPPNMRTWSRGCGGGRQVHVYSDAERIVLQLRCLVPTTEDVLAPSFKVAVRLSPQDALAIAGELLAVASRVLEARPSAADGPQDGPKPETGGALSVSETEAEGPCPPLPT